MTSQYVEWFVEYGENHHGKIKSTIYILILNPSLSSISRLHLFGCSLFSVMSEGPCPWTCLFVNGILQTWLVSNLIHGAPADRKC